MIESHSIWDSNHKLWQVILKNTPKRMNQTKMSHSYTTLNWGKIEDSRGGNSDILGEMLLMTCFLLQILVTLKSISKQCQIFVGSGSPLLGQKKALRGLWSLPPVGWSIIP